MTRNGGMGRAKEAAQNSMTNQKETQQHQTRVAASSDRDRIKWTTFLIK